MGWSLLIKLLILMNLSKLMCRVDTVGGWGIQLILFCLQSILEAGGEGRLLLP